MSNFMQKNVAGALLVAGLAMAPAAAEAMPVQSLSAGASSASSSTEDVWCCRYGWRGYGWRGGYGWRRPLVGYGYGWRQPYGWRGYHVGIRGPRVGSYAR